MNSVHGSHAGGGRRYDKVFILLLWYRFGGWGEEVKEGVRLYLPLKEVAFIKMSLLTCEKAPIMTYSS